MHKIVNPQQTRLFDPYDRVLTEKTRRRLLGGWPGVFRHVILELMPVDTISGHFDPTMGRPTKELYSMAGLILLMEFMDWTKDQALDAYRFHMNVHYALNLEPVTHDIAKRTLEHCLLWGNTAVNAVGESAQIYDDGLPVINNSCIQGWTGLYGGTGNTGKKSKYIK